MIDLAVHHTLNTMHTTMFKASTVVGLMLLFAATDMITGFDIRCNDEKHFNQSDIPNDADLIEISRCDIGQLFTLGSYASQLISFTFPCNGTSQR